MLLDELRSLVNQPDGCVVGQWASTQDTELQDLLVALAKKPGVNFTAVLSVLHKNISNLPFKRTAFIAHLKGQCSCPVT
jgi:hypothetical protein